MERKGLGWWLGAGVLLTLVALIIGSLLAWSSYTEARSSWRNEVRVVQLEGIIKLEDEILTTSARLAATTGDLAWEARYKTHDAKIDAAFAEMIAISPSDATEVASASSMAANVALAEMELRAFVLVRDGDLRGAQQQVLSAEYEHYRRTYETAMSATTSLIHRSIEASMHRRTSQVLAQAFVGTILLLLAVAAWVRAVLQLRSREKRLATALDDSQQAQGALREAMSALEKMHVELVAKEKLSSIGMLAAGVAHEINNPMAYVTMNVHALLEDLRETPDLPPLLQDYVAELLPSTIDGISRVNTIVRDLQQFARGDAEELADFDLNAEISAAARISKNQLKGRVTLDLALDELRPMHGKPRQLTQVMVNLIINAAHAIGDRVGGRIAITSAREPDGTALVTVTDNGCGMPADVQERVFQPFFTTKEVGRGTGLGLFVAYGIVTAHGGTIEVSSVVDVGTTFTLRFPTKAENETGAPRDAHIAA